MFANKRKKRFCNIHKVMNAIVTGGTRGIGRDTAIALAAQNGNTVVVTGRDIESLNKMAQSAPNNNIIPYHVDFNDNSSTFDGFFDHVKNCLNGIDILINNAGVLVKKDFLSMTAEDEELMLKVNFMAPSRLIRALIPLMNKGCHIVNISSMGGYQGSSKFPGLSVYSATKAALACLTECLAVELSGKDIRVNCIAPGSVNTDMLKQAFPGYKAQSSSEAMGSFIADFAVNASALINGKIIPVSLNNP
jgi:NAD(P)-dependent dehydrogenase (short-subunit alcohol dehydrogenase family)